MTVPRVRYAEKQILRAVNLTGEQTYRMLHRRRHILAAHGWGIVHGLMLFEPDDSGFWLQPGLAMDGYGREIRLPEQYHHPWLPANGPKIETSPYGMFDVWLLYAQSPWITPRRGSYPCGPGQHDRWRESFILEVEYASPEEVDPWQPPGLAAADHDFAAWDDLPDDPARRWPVYLGRMEVAESGSQVISVARPYVSLMGETATAASSESKMDVGMERGGGWRFAVSPRNPDTGVVEDDRLVIDSFGRNTVLGRLRLQRPEAQTDGGNEAVLILPERDPGKDFSYGISFDKPAEEPSQATPWRMYHTEAKQPEQLGQPPPPPVDQLRMELFHPEDRGNPSLYELVIGAAEAVPDDEGKTKFVPRLRIGADGSVTVYGNVTVTGSLTQGPIPADPTDQRFVDAVLAGRGRGESADQIDSTFRITISADSGPVVGNLWIYNFEVKNEGLADLASVVIRVDVILPDRAVSETLPMIARLEAGKSTGVFKRQITPAVSGKLSVTVTAVGFGPQMRSMFKQEPKEFDIVEPDNE